MLWRDSTRPLIMGIVNVTPDSFSGDGQTSVEAAIAQGLRMIKDGADILDIGGESTRPGAEPIHDDEELSRVIPVIRGLRAQTNIPISIDTFKAGVAGAALDHGADWINDVTGGQSDPAMLPLAAKRQCPIVLMHNRAAWMGLEQPYDDFMEDLYADLHSLKSNALAAGVAMQNIIVDPGIGFGKTVAQNCQIIRDLSRLHDLDVPILIGASRKSFIGKILGTEAGDRLEGTAAAIALSVAHGAAILRVHDVKEMRKVANMTWAIARP